MRAIVAKGAAGTLTRKEIDKLTEHAKGIGAKGLAYIRYMDDTPNCSFGKFISEECLGAILSAVSGEKGDVVLIVADKTPMTLSVLGKLRILLAKKLNLIPEGNPNGVYHFLWITEFPFFEWNEETEALGRHASSLHHADGGVPALS